MGTGDVRTERVKTSYGGDQLVSSVWMSVDDSCAFVHVVGDLDVTTRDAVVEACLDEQHASVVVEMAEVSFMDCCGYGGLVAARAALIDRGGSLTLRNETGQPALLLALIATLESR